MFKKVVGVERIMSNKKSHGVYDVAFEDSDCANEFSNIKKLKFKKKLLRRRLLQFLFALFQELFKFPVSV